MRLIAVGRLRQGPEQALFARYAARIRPSLVVREIAEAAGSPVEMRRKEAASLLAALDASDLAVALDLGGKAPSSEGFAALLQGWEEAGRRPAFLIGGAEGLAPEVIDGAAYILSLGNLTWPHRLVRVMLAEQIFRAQAIRGGHPYHRAARPGS